MNTKCNILVEIGHPAHVHFFKNPISIWKKQGHKIIIVTRDKEITHPLLDEIGLKYIPLTKQKTNYFFMIFELLFRWVAIFFIIIKEKINVAISISGISTAFPAYIARIVSITLTDTEDAYLTNSIAFRFSRIVLVPSTFLHKSKFSNIQTYNSFHELAYLHPNWFKPEKKNLLCFGIHEHEKYILMRTIKWKSLHDINETGISEDGLRILIDIVLKKGYKIYLSSERRISKEFEKYRIKGDISKIFDLMAFSSGYIGESPTMAVEAALIGKPSVLVNSRVRALGNMIELQNKYGILFNFEKFDPALEFIKNEFFTDATSGKILNSRNKLLKEKIDISMWIAQFTIDYTTNFYSKG